VDSLRVLTTGQTGERCVSGRGSSRAAGPGHVAPGSVRDQPDAPPRVRGPEGALREKVLSLFQPRTLAVPRHKSGQQVEVAAGRAWIAGSSRGMRFWHIRPSKGRQCLLSRATWRSATTRLLIAGFTPTTPRHACSGNTDITGYTRWSGGGGGEHLAANRPDPRVKKPGRKGDCAPHKRLRGTA
jgi:hypothetical protein